MDLTELSSVENTEEKTKINISDVEKEILEISEANANLNPVDIAANFYTTFYPRYIAHLSNCNNKDLKRLCRNIVGWPLIDNQTPNLHSSSAKEAWKLAQALMQARQVMLMNAQIGKAMSNETTVKQGEKTDGLET